MILMGRETPEPAAEVLFFDIGIIALENFPGKRQLAVPDNPERVVPALVMMDGYMYRKHGLPPGHQ